MRFQVLICTMFSGYFYDTLLSNEEIPQGGFIWSVNTPTAVINIISYILELPPHTQKGNKIQAKEEHKLSYWWWGMTLNSLLASKTPQCSIFYQKENRGRERSCHPSRLQPREKHTWITMEKFTEGTIIPCIFFYYLLPLSHLENAAPNDNATFHILMTLPGLDNPLSLCLFLSLESIFFWRQLHGK